MRYSVYNYDDRTWHYFEASGTVPPTGWFRKGSGAPVAEKLVAPLPPDAVEVGIGNSPQGVIAAHDQPEPVQALAGLGEVGSVLPGSFLQWLGLAVVVGGAFYLGRKSVETERKARAAWSAARGAL